MANLSSVVSALFLTAILATCSLAGSGVGFDAALSVKSTGDHHDIPSPLPDYVDRRTAFNFSLAPTVRIPLGLRLEVDPYLKLEVSVWGAERENKDGDRSYTDNGNNVVLGCGAGLFFELLEQTRIRLSAGPQVGMLVDPDANFVWLSAGGVGNLDVFVSTRMFFRMGPRFLMFTMGIDTDDNNDDRTVLVADWLAAEMRFGMFVNF